MHGPTRTIAQAGKKSKGQGMQQEKRASESAWHEAVQQEQHPVRPRHPRSAHKHRRHLGVIEPAGNGAVDGRHNEGGHGGGAGGD